MGERSSDAESVSASESVIVSDEGSAEDRSKRLKTETAAEIDNFERLYETAFEFIQKTMKVTEAELENGIGTVIKSFRYREGNRFSDVDFTKSENLCAYFRRFSQLSTELSRSKILLALEECEELQSRFNCTPLSVMCIGGGPGFEIVGLCSALHEKTSYEELHLSVVDPVKRWESFLEIIGFLLREGDFGRSCEMFKEMNASLEFFGVPAEDTLNLPYSKALKGADVILMKGFLSILKDMENTIETVVTGMKEGAMLLIIDSPHCCKLQNNHLKQIFTTVEDSNQIFEIRRRYQMAFSSNAQIAVFKKTKSN